MNVFLVLSAFFLGCVLSESPSEEEEKFLAVVTSCNTNNLTTERVDELVYENVLPWSKEEKCLMECVATASGAIGSDGNFNLSGAKELNEKRLSGTELELANEVAERCSKLVPKGLVDCNIGHELPKCINDEDKNLRSTLAQTRTSDSARKRAYCSFCLPNSQFGRKARKKPVVSQAPRYPEAQNPKYRINEFVGQGAPIDNPKYQIDKVVDYSGGQGYSPPTTSSSRRNPSGQWDSNPPTNTPKYQIGTLVDYTPGQGYSGPPRNNPTRNNPSGQRDTYPPAYTPQNQRGTVVDNYQGQGYSSAQSNKPTRNNPSGPWDSNPPATPKYQIGTLVDHTPGQGYSGGPQNNPTRNNPSGQRDSYPSASTPQNQRGTVVDNYRGHGYSSAQSNNPTRNNPSGQWDSNPPANTPKYQIDTLVDYTPGQRYSGAPPNNPTRNNPSGQWDSTP